jgi:hypothetical protein
MSVSWLSVAAARQGPTAARRGRDERGVGGVVRGERAERDVVADSRVVAALREGNDVMGLVKLWGPYTYVRAVNKKPWLGSKPSQCGCPSAPALAQVHLVNQLVHDGGLAVAQAPGSSYKSPKSG